MLRRVKADVDLQIPPKKELLVYAPLSQLQHDLYESTVDKTILKKLKVVQVGCSVFVMEELYDYLVH